MIRSNKGQALVEFALILPLLLLILFGIVDFGRVYYNKTSLENLSQIVMISELKGLDHSELTQLLLENGFEDNFELYNNTPGDGFTTIYLSTEIYLYTPGLGVIIENPFTIETKKVYPN